MEEVTNCFGDIVIMCWICSSIVNLLTLFLFPAGKSLELSEDAVVTLYSWETGLLQTLAGAGAVTNIGFAPLSTAEGDGLVMG